MQKISKYLLLFFSVIFISCTDEKDEITPDQEPTKPKILSLSPTVGLPGDTITVSLANPDEIEIKGVLINDLETYFQIISAEEISVVIPHELSRSENVIIEVVFPEYSINNAGFLMAAVTFESINLDTIVLGDTLIITGENFADDIDEVYIGKPEHFNKENDYLLRSIEIIKIEENQITAFINSTYSLAKFQNYRVGLRIGDSYYYVNQNLYFTLTVRKAQKFNPESNAPGSLLLFDVFNSGAEDLEIIIDEDTLKNPLWTWSGNGYDRAYFETPYALLPGQTYYFRALKQGNELIVENNSIKIEEPTYTFTPSSFDKTVTHDIIFALSHVYLDNSYSIKLISQLNGEEVWEWSGPNQVEQNILGDGSGIELTVTAYSLTFDGSYYVQITAGLESYELSPAGNNVITFE